MIKAAPLYLDALLGPAGCADPLPEGGRASPSDPPAWFDEVARASGLDFVHQSGHGDRYLFPETACGGGALFDMDGDGDLDVYLIQSGRLVEPPEEAIAMSATYQQVIDACNSGDLERAAELETANRPACPEGCTASFEGLRWTLSPDRLTGTLRVERVRADNGCTDVQTPTFKNVEGIWLLDSIK